MTWKNKKVIVTGATGFIGSSLIDALVAGGAQVTAVTRVSSNPKRIAHLPITVINADITRPQSMPGIFDGCDYVVHAAGMLGQAGQKEESYHKLHVQGSGYVLDEISCGSSSAKILYVSSPGVLGPNVKGLPVDEKAPLAPSNAYERSKAAAEQLVLNYAQAGLHIVIARPEFVYGPGDTHVLRLFQAVQSGRFFFIGNGKNTCHPTFISDAVSGMLACLKKGIKGEIYHITGPRPVSFRELAHTIALTLNVKPPQLQIPKPFALAGAMMLEGISALFDKNPPLSRSGVAFFSEDRRFSYQKAAAELDYKPEIDLQRGIEITVDWYRQQGFLS